MSGYVLAVIAAVTHREVGVGFVDSELSKRGVESHGRRAHGRMPQVEILLVALSPVIESRRECVIVNCERAAGLRDLSPRVTRHARRVARLTLGQFLL